MKEYKYAYQYNIAIIWPKYMYVGGVIQVNLFWEKYVWLLNKG